MIKSNIVFLVLICGGLHMNALEGVNGELVRRDSGSRSSKLNSSSRSPSQNVTSHLQGQALPPATTNVSVLDRRESKNEEDSGAVNSLSEENEDSKPPQSLSQFLRDMDKTTYAVIGVIYLWAIAVVSGYANSWNEAC